MRYCTVEVPINLADLSNPVTVEMHGTRSKGTHLTDILQAADKDSGRLKERIVWGRNTWDELDEENLPCCMFAGMMFETALMQMFPWLQRIGELYRDGIAMSPDAVSYNCRRHLLSPQASVPVVLHEAKLTWSSSRSGLEKHLRWLQQTKSYCKALGTLYVVLWVFYVNGSYVFDGSDAGPHLHAYHIAYTPWEIENNWCSVLRDKSRFGL